MMYEGAQVIRAPTWGTQVLNILGSSPLLSTVYRACLQTKSKTSAANAALPLRHYYLAAQSTDFECDQPCHFNQHFNQH